jgi:cytochrome b pre-mRNA-processing protein 3
MRVSTNRERNEGIRRMSLSQIFGLKRSNHAVASLYRALVEQARTPIFYEDFGVPDSLDGRFEMIAMHMFLVLHRLKSDGTASAELAQSLFDTMFEDMDRSLREIGVGDLAVGKRVRAMGEALYGRMAAYETGLAGDDTTLAAAFRRNLFGTVPEPGPSTDALASLARYLRASVQSLAGQAAREIAAGHLAFSPARP